MMNAIDRSVVKALLSRRADTQEELASQLGVEVRQVRDSLLRLKKSGIVELIRDGVRRIPELRIFGQFDRLEEEFTSLVGAVTA
jgi:predicted transcriptional regulator